MKPEEIRPLKDIRDYLDQWMDRHKKANDIAPDVQNMRDIIDWEIQAYENCPTEARTIFPENLTEQHNCIYRYITANIPMIPSYPPDDIRNSFIVTTSGTTSTLVYISRVGSLGTQEARTYSEKYNTSYLIIQGLQERQKAVCDAITRLGNANTLERFGRALKARDAVKSGIGERTAASLEIRNLLYGVKGVLFKKAFGDSNENKTWNKMAERLAKNGPSGTEYHELVSQEAKFEFLIGLLSTIGKDRESKDLGDIESIWAQTLDHVFIVLGLIKS